MSCHMHLLSVLFRKSLAQKVQQRRKKSPRPEHIGLLMEHFSFRCLLTCIFFLFSLEKLQHKRFSKGGKSPRPEHIGLIKSGNNVKHTRLFQFQLAHHSLYQYPRSDPNSWLSPSFLVSYNQGRTGTQGPRNIEILPSHSDKFILIDHCPAGFVLNLLYSSFLAEIQRWTDIKLKLSSFHELFGRAYLISLGNYHAQNGS